MGRVGWMVGALWALALAGCTPGETTGDEADGGAVDAASGGPDRGATPDGGAPDAGPSACEAGDPAACAYTAALSARLDRRIGRPLTYTDVTGAARTIDVELRLPAGAPTPAPVVVWSHGGSGGNNAAETVGEEWAQQFVRAGYAVLAIAHAPRARAEYEALCAALDWADGCAGAACADDAECVFDGAPGTCVQGGCRFWKHLSWDRPHDFAAAVDMLEGEVAPGAALEGVLDLARLVYAGHSAGAGATLMVAGATRQFNGVATLLMDPRPVAFISASPQGPGDDDFTEASFSGAGCEAVAEDPSGCLARPHLFLTGAGDDTESVAENRRLSFELAPLGDRHLAWITEEAAVHTTFEHQLAGCERHQAREGGDAARCEDYRAWLRSVALAFLDHHLRASPEAGAYLRSDFPTRLSEGAMTWEHR